MSGGGPATPIYLSAGSTPNTMAPLLPSFPIQGQADRPVSSLPSPSTFDLLPPLHELVSRVLLAESSGNTEAVPGPNPVLYPNQQPIPIHQLAAEMSIIRNRIRKARVAIEALPDVDRDLQEQMVEIQQLKDRIEKQTRVLQGLSETQ